LQVTPCDFLSRAIFSRRHREIPGRVPINTLIEKPKTLRWRSVAAMLLAFTERVDLNRVLRPGNIVARNRRPTGAARRADISVKLEG
jgi:hypothetical protein